MPETAWEALHGYGAKTGFEDMLGGTWSVNIGQVYLTLQRLERDGLVAAHGPKDDRGRQVYELTSRGRQELRDWLTKPPSAAVQLQDELYVKLLLARRLPTNDRELLIRRQRAA